VVDVTNASLGRHPLALRAISEQVEVNIVLGAGLYRHQYFEAAWVDRTSTNAMAEWIVGDLTVGVADTGIRTGIISEIACDEWLTAQEEAGLPRGGASPQEDGSDHHDPCGSVAHRLSAARPPGGGGRRSPARDRRPLRHRQFCRVELPANVMEYHEALARRGAYVQFDTIRQGRGHEIGLRLAYTRNLIEKGHLDQILLSHDVCQRSHLRAYVRPR
jgi:predicted metal-dependent phosphotriesterase family hydrolase